MTALVALRRRTGARPAAERAARPSACFLLGKPAARTRLELLERTNDGFVIAEEDLRKRGMGDLIGVRQAGENLEGLASAELDLDLLLLARELVAGSPALTARYASQRPLA